MGKKEEILDKKYMYKKGQHSSLLDMELIVPEFLQERQELINHAEWRVSSSKILPPSSYHQLSRMAQEIIEVNNLNPSFKAFLMICCGNAIWRKAFEKIPYQRRILLLPECLKDSQHCNAEKDTFGVLCSACGSCSINDILNEAEDLGYVTMITEGATITKKLIEEGNIEAVIGVGCMETLQKMHKSVNKYAIPSIAIPLLYNGCKDTSIDKRWLLEELRRYSENNSFHKINLQELLHKIKILFNKNRVSALMDHPTDKTGEIAMQYVLSEGQRLRPVFTVMMYEAFACEKEKEKGEEIADRLAFAVECFHKASLIHDDIEDNDVERYGEKTIHVKYGVPVAINTGDYLIGLGYRLISACELEPAILARCIQVVSEGHLTISAGQGEELINKQDNAIVNTREMINIAKNKTSAAFKVALLLGTIAADVNHKTEKIIGELSDYIGIAYQIKDDLDDFNGDAGDLLSDNYSIIRALLFDSLSKKEKEQLLTSLMNRDMNSIIQSIQENNIVEKAKELMQTYLDKAFSCLGNITNLKAKLAIHESIGKIFHAYL